MKRISILAITAIFLTVGVAIAGQTYAPESKDNTIEQRNQVQVKETDTSAIVKTRILTLMQIDLDLIALDARIQFYKDKKIMLQAVRVFVQTIADTVVLKQ